MTTPTEKIETYREGLRRRLRQPLSRVDEVELDRAFSEAEQLAQTLKNEYGAKRVVLFGSVARRWPLRLDSDIDLAVEGMPVEAYYELVGDLYTESGRTVDLVRLESLRPSIKQLVTSEGVELADDDA